MTLAAPTSPRFKLPSETPMALVASFAALLAIFYIIDGVRGKLMHVIARDHLEELLKTSSIEPVEKTLAYIETTREEKNWLSLSIESSQSVEQRRAILQSAVALRAALIAENRALIRIATGELTHSFLDRHSFPQNRSSTLANIQRLLSADLREHQKVILEVSKISTMQKATDKEISLLRTRYDLIEDDLNELFSLNLKARRERGDFAFYKAGVLAGLPTVAEIPDDLADLVALREALEKAGGRVRIEGENAHELFNEKLDQIKSQGSEIFRRYEELEREHLTHEATLHALKNERRYRRERLISSVNHLILTLI